MKNIVLISLLGLLIITGCVSGFIMNLSDTELNNADKLPINSSFEEGEYNYNELPKGWMVFDKPQDTVFWDKDVFRSGNKSLKIENPFSNIKIISDAFNIDPGAIYYIQAFAKSQKITSKQVAIYFFVFDKEGKKVNVFKHKYFIEDKWTKLTLSAGFFKSSAKFARVIIIIPRKTDNTFWVDDVEVYNIHSFKKRK